MNGAAEWLEADGLGGFAMGRVDLLRTRRYHGLLIAARRPPGDRVVLVNGFDARIELDTGSHAVVQQRYAPDVTAPAERLALAEFTADPWPCWTYSLPGGGELVQQLFVPHGEATVTLAWRVHGRRGRARLVVRPFLSGRGTHDTHHENGALRFDALRDRDAIRWQTYDGVPAVVAHSNGEYRHDPHWYRNFEYDEERARGLDFHEDLAAPGELTFDLAAEEGLLVFSADLGRGGWAEPSAVAMVGSWRTRERERRSGFATPLHRAADAYVVARGTGRTIVAGYPWFTDWGRDTFIAMRGICLAGGRLDDAAAILLEWSRVVSEGMLPNYFPEAGQAPEYNAVDASLWFVVAAHELLARADVVTLADGDRQTVEQAMQTIVAGYAKGTRFGIGMDNDALLAAGEAGWQLTWMDARADGREVTPRIGKPVEVQALWINALRAVARMDAQWSSVAEHAEESFVRRFWDADRGWLADVADVGHVAGAMDWTLRPNQVLAVGGLPWRVIGGDAAARVLETVERELWTTAGLRTLSPGDPAYRPRYEGGVSSRDSAYHQGTVWPWLAGAFVDGWVAVRGGSDDARREAHDRFLEPLIRHYADCGIGHVAEIADADPPHTPRGCPFQAWSVGEALRMQELLRGRGGTPQLNRTGAIDVLATR